MIIRITSLILTVALALPAAVAKGDVEGLEDSLVEVLVTYQQYDPLLPWQKGPPGSRRGYGVVLAGAGILTSESLVRNHTLVEIRKVGSGEKIPVEVKTSDSQVDLALLKADDERQNRLSPLKMAGRRVSKDQKVTLAQFSGSDDIQRGGGKVLDIGVESLPNAPHSCLLFSVLSDLSVKAKGAAVLRKGKLAGLVLDYDRGTRTAKVLPYPLIDRFVNDFRKPPFRGFASAGFLWAPLVDPHKRSYLNVNDKSGGILVLATLPGTGARQVLEANDVILEWDGYSIDRLGYYADPDFGKLRVQHLIHGRRSAGESAEVRVVRNGKERKLRVALQRKKSSLMLIPENYLARPPSYVIHGGFVLRELTGRYLRAHGGRWKKRLPSKLVHTYLTERFFPEDPGDRIVILSRVLPDAVNVGYQGFRNSIVTHVNGKRIRNLNEVFRLLEKSEAVSRIRLRGMDVDLVLDRGSLEEANARIARKYRIPALRRKSN
jgi:S1-C subfamily serine protease